MVYKMLNVYNLDPLKEFAHYNPGGSIHGDSGGLMYTKEGTTYKVIGPLKGGSVVHVFGTKHSYLPWLLSIPSY